MVQEVPNKDLGKGRKQINHVYESPSVVLIRGGKNQGRKNFINGIPPEPLSQWRGKTQPGGRDVTLEKGIQGRPLRHVKN